MIPMAKIIAVANRKGGVGKTTTILCLAHFLGRRNRRVLVIDLDPQNALRVALVPRGQPAGAGVIGILRGAVEPSDVVEQTPLVNVDLISYGSPESLCDEHEGLFAMREKRAVFARCLLNLSRSYDYVLIDSPPGSSAIVQFTLFHAESVIIPVQCQPLALRIIPRILKDIKELIESADRSLKVEGVLLTMYEFWNPLSQSVADQVLSCFPKESTFFRAVIRRSPAFEKIFDPQENPLLQEDLPEELLDYDNIAWLILAKEEEAASPAPKCSP